MSTPATQPWQQDLVASARVALACLDLTSLNDTDSESDIARLCERAQGPFGPVAAVCVWPRLAACARQRLPGHIAVAAVANFPTGGTAIEPVLLSIIGAMVLVLALGVFLPLWNLGQAAMGRGG